MERQLDDVWKLVVTVFLILYILNPIFQTMLNSYKAQGQIYKEKSYRYEEVIKP